VEYPGRIQGGSREDREDLFFFDAAGGLFIYILYSFKKTREEGRIKYRSPEGKIKKSGSERNRRRFLSSLPPWS
jgi:hypothetical protein